MTGRTALPRLGSVERGSDRLLPWLVLDGAGREVEPVSDYLRDRSLGDVSPLTCRSYAYDLLRWFRVLWLVDVGWEQATGRRAGRLAALGAQPAAGAHPSGRVSGRVGEPEDRQAGWPTTRRSSSARPTGAAGCGRRFPARQPRAIPDAQWDGLFAQMRCARDRVLLACYVSSGARASELLGVQLGDVDRPERCLAGRPCRSRAPRPRLAALAGQR
jgi:integrase